MATERSHALDNIFLKVGGYEEDGYSWMSGNRGRVKNLYLMTIIDTVYVHVLVYVLYVQYMYAHVQREGGEKQL